MAPFLAAEAQSQSRWVSLVGDGLRRKQSERHVVGDPFSDRFLHSSSIVDRTAMMTMMMNNERSTGPSPAWPVSCLSFSCFSFFM